jgi:hypothetical protein
MTRNPRRRVPRASRRAAPPALASGVRWYEWGVGILAAQADGKNRYLFENGEERTLAQGFQELMLRVDKPNAEQQAAYARLRGVLAARAPAQSNASSFVGQLSKFHEAYPSGLSDPKWIAQVRGDGTETRSPLRRQALLQKAQELLSLKALDAHLSAQHFGQVWEQVVTVLRASDVVPSAQFKLKIATEEHRRALAVSVRELLHGSSPFEARFDRFVAAFTSAFGTYPRWELATALSAVMHPADHVCVEPTTFRKQLKTISTRSVAVQPNSAAYGTFLGIARLVANKLAEQGEVPRDLFDARDFIVTTLKPSPKARVVREKARPVDPD